MMEFAFERWQPKTHDLARTPAYWPHSTGQIYWRGLGLGWTISDDGLLCQPEVGFHAELDVASIWKRARVFTLTGYHSIFLGTVSLSNRKKGIYLLLNLPI